MAQQPHCRHARSLVVLTLALVSIAACTQAPPAAGSGEGGWLAGTPDEKFETVAKHLRGFDMAMVETGYRYNELYWAARDSNWGYAQYQTQKIRLAIEGGLERRPKRAASAQIFLGAALPAVEDAIARRDANLLRERVGAMRLICNACHVAEKVEFVHVGEPQVRPSTALR
jgi:hypothetical protein